MLIFLILAIIIIIGLILVSTWEWEELGAGLFFIGIGLFIIAGCFLASGMATTATLPQQRTALQNTYDSSRAQSGLERATITRDIAQFNKDLAVFKYWNNSLWVGWFIHDAVENVEPIK